MDLVLGFDIGATNARWALAEVSQPGIVYQGTVDTDPDSFDSTMERLSRSIRAAIPFRPVYIRSVAAAVAGNVDGGVLLGSGNLPGWKGVDIARRLEGYYGCPAEVVNDCQASAYGEYAELKRPLKYVAWSSGIGVAILCEQAGHSVALATELGHMVVPNAGAPVQCGCGGLDHLEALASGKNITRRFGVARHDQLVMSQWRVIMDDLAAGLYNISLVGPTMPIVLGGGVALGQAHRLPALWLKLAQLVGDATQAPEILPSRLGDDNGLVGAVHLARQLLAAA